MLQLITRIPAHGLPTHELQQVAVGVETCGEIHFSFSVGQAAIAVGINVHVAGEVVRALVAHLQQVTRSVVAVTLCVVADLTRIIRRQRLQARQRRAMAGTVADFTAAGFDQLIQRVVLEATDRFDKLVVTIAVWLGRIVDHQNITDRVIAVNQLLQQRAIRRHRVERTEPTVLRIILEMTDNTIARRFLLDLVKRVVTYFTDQRLRLCGTGQCQFSSFQLPSDGHAKGLRVAHGIGLHEHFAQRIETPAGLQPDKLKQRIALCFGQRPVRTFRRLQKMPFLTQRIAKQAVIMRQTRACRIVMANQLIALVMLNGVGATIGQAFDDKPLLCHRDRAQRTVVFHQALSASPVPAFKQLPCLAHQVQSPTRVDAFAQQGRSGQTEPDHPICRGLRFGFRATEQTRITTDNRTPCPVIALMGHLRAKRLPGHSSTELHATHGQRTWFNDHQYRRIAVHNRTHDLHP
ncbi:Uncharacterized protein AC505_1439 [Pseudomonas syringae pv. maculicola]|nr:Uncharacterized protein AC505_1439 [Pseudomonas syringae pv. maculicola]